ncbi:MAG: DUF1566 domain-containing protein [Rhodoplanes sp.]|nr:DUF1566 domain-containing protein [Rhodoplanes sp.]
MKGAILLVAVVCALPTGGVLAGCYDRTANGSQHRFVLDGGEALDTRTGLTWKRCSLGRGWDGRQCAGETAFDTLDQAVEAAAAAGAGWRVPSGPELESIVDPSCGRPVVDESVFPDISADEEGTAKYWTTNEVGLANLVYYFDFMTGQADGHSRGFRLAVRLVRG